MKRTSLLSLLAIAVMSVSVAAADLYVGGSIENRSLLASKWDTAGTETEYKSESGLGVAFSVGTYLDHPFIHRLEASVSGLTLSPKQKANEAIKGSVSAKSVEMNGFYHLPLDLPVNVFVGAGVGLADLTIGQTAAFVSPSSTANVHTQLSSIVPTYQLNVGTEYDALTHIVSLGYKYVGAFSDATYQLSAGAQELKVPYGEHRISLGLRFNI